MIGTARRVHVRIIPPLQNSLENTQNCRERGDDPQYKYTLLTLFERRRVFYEHGIIHSPKKMRVTAQNDFF